MAEALRNLGNIISVWSDWVLWWLYRCRFHPKDHVRNDEPFMWPLRLLPQKLWITLAKRQLSEELREGTASFCWLLGRLLTRLLYSVDQRQTQRQHAYRQGGALDSHWFWLHAYWCTRERSTIRDFTFQTNCWVCSHPRRTTRERIFTLPKQHDPRILSAPQTLS